MSGLRGNADVLENHLLVVGQLRDRTAELMQLIGVNLGRLGGAWQDSKFPRFEEDIKSAMARLEAFCTLCDGVGPDLQKDIDIIRRYLKS